MPRSEEKTLKASNHSSFGQLSMPVATRISTSSHHQHCRAQTYASHSLPHQAHQGLSDSTSSDSSEGVEELFVGGLRRVGAESCQNPSEERRSRAQEAMTSSTPRIFHSHSKINAKETYVKGPRVVVRDVRRKSETERRHHRRRSEREDEKEGERVHVYKAHKKSEVEADHSRPGTLRRSTTNAGEAIRTKNERLRTGDAEIPRRHSERRPSHYEETVHTSLRREKRSIADHVPKSTRDRVPLTR